MAYRRRRKTAVSGNVTPCWLMRPGTRRFDPNGVRDELVEVTPEWINTQPAKRLYRYAQATWRFLLKQESFEYQQLFAFGILTEADRAQDMIYMRRISEGLRVLAQVHPRVTVQARQFVERHFFLVQGL